MYPYDLFFDIDLYDIFMMIGLISAIIVYDLYVSKRDIPAKVQNFYLFLGVISIVVGLFSATLFQSVFNWIETGVFEWRGMTFYGGVIGGVATFLIGLFAVGGKIFKEKEHLLNFTHVYEVAPCCITIAHGFGRIGCLFAGCCYGMEVGGFPGLHMHSGFGHGEGYFLPTQLYESVFLFALFIVLSIFYKKGKNINFIVYLIAYGIWRFAIEFLRADDRGMFLPFLPLTPAQVISLCMIIAGVIMIIYRNFKNKKTA